MSTIKTLITEKYEILKTELLKYKFDENYFNYDVETIYNYAKYYYFQLNESDLKTEILKSLNSYLNNYSDTEKTEINNIILNFILFLKSLK